MYRCPKCFWLQYNKGLRQPEGIVSRLANRFDVILKKYFDLYRSHGELPPMIEGQVEGKLESPFQEKYFWDYNEKYGLTGRLDDCLIRDDGTYTPVDHKTASSDPREKDILSAYQHQLNFYAFLLEKNGKKTSGFGHLIYYFPEHGDKLHNGVPIQVHIQIMRTFAQLKEFLLAHKELALRLDALERKFGEHDDKIRVVFEAMRELLDPPQEASKPKIGFHP